MASSTGGQSTEGQGGGSNGRGGPRGGAISVTINGETLASILASREQLQKAAEEFMAVSEREAVALRRMIARQEGVIACLNDRVAELTRHREGPANPGEGVNGSL